MLRGIILVLILCPIARADFPPLDQLRSQSDMPDPLVTFHGQRVITRDQWMHERRPELKALFQHYMYGQIPAAPHIHTKITRTDSTYFGGKATLKEITILVGHTDPLPMHLLLVVPNNHRPAPVFAGLNFCGNHTILHDPKIALPTVWMPEFCPGVKQHRATAAGRGTQVDVWSIEYVVDHGYGVATCYCGDVAPDHAGFTGGVFAHPSLTAGHHHRPNDWGAIAAWAWGLSRLVDYLLMDPDVDKDRIAMVGHSRLGKAAIVAAAFDERIALAIPHQAGCGGTAPSRGKIGESVKQINDRFPHWFDAEFKKFNGQPERLPFDQNCLVALVAPRPVLFTNGTEDQWANPAGQFDVLKAADPVYRFLGVDGLDAKRMPPVNTLVASRLGYHIRPGKHSMGKQDWEVWLRYAERRLTTKR